MRKVKRLYKLYIEGISKRKISTQLGISRNTVSKYIAFFKRYKLTYAETCESHNLQGRKIPYVQIPF